MIGSSDRNRLLNGAALKAARHLSETGDERRRDRRSSVAWHGQVLVDGAPSVECAVLNVSLRGAKLRLRLPIDLPPTFTLSIARFGELPAELLDQNQAVVRVGFLVEPDAVKRFFRNQLPQFRDDAAES